MNLKSVLYYYCSHMAVLLLLSQGFALTGPSADSSAHAVLRGSLPTSFRALSRCHLFSEMPSWTVLSEEAPTPAGLHSLIYFSKKILLGI